jgi:tetratricopeptide (TPR) repeat protein
MHLVSRESGVPLSKFDKAVLEGVQAADEVIPVWYPDFKTRGAAAVESEAMLLQSIRSASMDAYMAYRVGILGVMIVRASAPFSGQPSGFRDVYYADVDGQINGIQINQAKRKDVTPSACIRGLRQQFASREATIRQDYAGGRGFGGVAKATLDEQANMVIAAIADIWCTALVGKPAGGAMSEAKVRDYIGDALEFYIKRNNKSEIESSYNRLTALSVVTPDLHKKIGDLFYAYQMFDKAIKEYNVVLEAQPDRKDVIERLTEYYLADGDKASEEARLEDALSSYQKARDMNPLNPETETKRLQAERELNARNERLNASRMSLGMASSYETQADQEAGQQNYAKALGLLKQAEEQYGAVTEEFPFEYQQATAALKSLESKSMLVKDKLIGGAQDLSGLGSVIDARHLAGTTTRDLDTRALEGLLQLRLKSEIDKIKAEYQAKFTPAGAK